MGAGPLVTGILFSLIFMILAPPLPVNSGEVSLDLGGGRIRRTIRSYHEIRQAETMRQRWDQSCGSAALSTILTYHFGDKISEAVIITSILRVTDPAKIRARGGFSLLDLKRFADTRGYEGKGYAGLTLDELNNFNSPAIVPVRVSGYDHFVVFRGKKGDRVLLSDPAFGLITMKISQFQDIWKGGVGFILFREGASSLANGLTPKEEDFLIPDSGAVIRANLRMGATPLSRRGP